MTDGRGAVRSTLAPLRVRRGARFTCHGDGLCCTDVHTFGPLSEAEAKALTDLDPRAVIVVDGHRMLPVRSDGACVFRSRDRCAIHAELGEAMKPATCRQFPFRLVATPTGGRVTTDHRCPCRTLGERAPITPDDALDAVGAATIAEASPDRRIEAVRFRAHEELALGAWEAIEAPLLARLARGEDPLRVLDATPLDPAATWRALATEHAAEDDPSGFGAALRRFGATVLRQLGEPSAVEPGSPFGAAFDAAEARSPDVVDPAAILADWLADVVWSLEWAFAGSFAQARVELATRVVIARAIAADRVAEGARPDRAMAEAIAVVELAGLAEDYEALVATLREPPAYRPA